MPKGKKVEFWPTFLNGGISALGSVVVLALAGAGAAFIFGRPEEDEGGKTVIEAETVEVQGGAMLASTTADGGDTCAGVMT